MGTVTCIGHKWTGQTDAGSTTFSRYKCSRCGCWGYRHWSKFGDRKIKAYQPTKYEPDESWFRDYGDKYLEIALANERKDIEVERWGEIRSKGY